MSPLVNWAKPKSLSQPSAPILEPSKVCRNMAVADLLSLVGIDRRQLVGHIAERRLFAIPSRTSSSARPKEL